MFLSWHCLKVFLFVFSDYFDWLFQRFHSMNWLEWFFLVCDLGSRGSQGVLLCCRCKSSQLRIRFDLLWVCLLQGCSTLRLWFSFFRFLNCRLWRLCLKKCLGSIFQPILLWVWIFLFVAQWQLWGRGFLWAHLFLQLRLESVLCFWSKVF